MVEAILKVKAPYDNEQACIDALLALRPESSPDNAWLKLLAIEALSVFGEGGNPDAQQVEMFIGVTNIPAQGGYVRVDVPDVYAQALEYVAANGGSEYAELVWVGWPGVPEPVLDIDPVAEGVQPLGVFAK